MATSWSRQRDFDTTKVYTQIQGSESKLSKQNVNKRESNATNDMFRCYLGASGNRERKMIFMLDSV